MSWLLAASAAGAAGTGEEQQPCCEDSEQSETLAVHFTVLDPAWGIPGMQDTGCILLGSLSSFWACV